MLVRREDADRNRIDRIAAVDATENGADVPIEEGSTRVGALEAVVRPFDDVFPQTDAPACEIGVLRHDGPTSGA